MKMGIVDSGFILKMEMELAKWKWIHFKMEMKWILPAGGPKWKSQNGFISILQNGNGNSKMEMNPFQNENEMESAGWDAKMEIAKWKKWFHFAKWK